MGRVDDLGITELAKYFMMVVFKKKIYNQFVDVAMRINMISSLFIYTECL